MNYDDPYGEPSGRPRTLAEVQAPPPHPVWLTFAATLGGLIIPAAAAIAAAILLGPPHVPHASRAAALAAAALTVAEAIFAGLGAAALVEAGWRRVGLPGSGPANFLPLRYIRHRVANRHVKDLISQLRDAPAQPSRESLRALLDLSRELARRDIYTRAHSGRVSRLSVEVGQKIGLTPEECEIARLAGLLHDIGKLEIPSAILNKPGPLDPDEAELVRNHPTIGAALVAPYIGADVVEAVRHHHERVDGAGYPDGVDGDALPVISRLVPVVDTYDALISDRSYRPGRSREEAFLELRAVAGTQLDAELVEVLIELESAKAPMGGAILGLAPVGALARKAEHLLHNSAAPAAAAITAIAVAGAGWLGVMSASPNTKVNALRPNRVTTSPTPTPSVGQDQPAAPAPDAAPMPTPTATASAPPTQALYFPGPNTKVGKTAKSGGVIVVPKTTTVPGKAGSPTTTNTTPKVIIVPPAPGGGGGAPAPPPTTGGGNPSKPPPPPPAPSISGISPNKGPASTAVTISGANFSGATSVKFGSTVAFFTINSASQISATAPPGSGPQPVTVIGPGGTSNASTFTYLGPIITSISNSGPAGIRDGDIFGGLGGGTSITIHGSGFSAASEVRFGNDPAESFQVNSDSQITAVSPAFSGTPEETVSVKTPADTGTSQQGTNEFDYDPNLIAISPSSGHAGTTVTISGTNLSGATSVSFGNNNATNFSVNSSGTRITADAPTPSSGSVDIVVNNDAGGSDTIGEDVFTYNRPSISSISSNGSSITISGSGFSGATAVRIGSTTLSSGSFSVDSDNSISAPVPNGTYNSQPVTVTTPVGTSNSKSFNFGPPPPPPPSISGVNFIPVPTGTVASGYQVAISGSALAGSNAGSTVVTWNGTTIGGATVTNSLITFDAPPGVAGSSITISVSTTSSPPAASTTVTYPPPHA